MDNQDKSTPIEQMLQKRLDEFNLNKNEQSYFWEGRELYKKLSYKERRALEQYIKTMDLI